VSTWLIVLVSIIGVVAYTYLVCYVIMRVIIAAQYRCDYLNINTVAIKGATIGIRCSHRRAWITRIS
jgi:hypothetical protein